LAKAFDPSSSAGAAVGPKAATPGSLGRIDDPGNQRDLRPDGDQIDATLAGRRDD
jgi:hypothetical protein